MLDLRLVDVIVQYTHVPKNMMVHYGPQVVP
jgi:uncharacterized membrane protein